MCLTGTWTIEKDVMNLKFVGFCVGISVGIMGIFSKQVGPGYVTTITSSAGQVMNIKALIHVTFWHSQRDLRNYQHTSALPFLLCQCRGTLG